MSRSWSCTPLGLYSPDSTNMHHSFPLYLLFPAVPPVVDTVSTLNSTKLITENISFYVNLKHTPNPPPTVTWLHDGLPMNTSVNRTQLSSDSLSLNLTHLALSDGGMYTVSITNMFESKKVMFFLDVQGMF